MLVNEWNFLSEEVIDRVSAITSPDRTGAKVYYQSGPDWYQSGPGLVRAMEASQPFGCQCPRLPLKNETGTNPYY